MSAEFENLGILFRGRLNQIIVSQYLIYSCLWSQLNTVEPC